MSPTNNFPLFVINSEFTLFITVIFPLLSKLFVLKFLVETSPVFVKFPEILISLFVEIKLELSTLPLIVILLLACICPEFVVFPLLISIAFSASNLLPISVSVEDILIFPLACVSFKNIPYP